MPNRADHPGVPRGARQTLVATGVVLVGALLTAPTPARSDDTASAPVDRPHITLGEEDVHGTHDQGLPAALADGSQVAYVEHDFDYSDAYSDTFYIDATRSGKHLTTILLRQTESNFTNPTPRAKVLSAIDRANRLLEPFVALLPYAHDEETEAEAVDRSDGYPPLRFTRGERVLSYRPKTGRLELRQGKTVLAAETVLEPRQWMCCGFASKDDGGCKAHPEGISEIAGNDQVVMVVLLFKSGKDGCEVPRFRHILPLAAAAAKRPAAAKPH